MSEIDHSQMMALEHHPDWDDGREGFVWCRFDAMLEPYDMLRAEITWDDTSGGLMGGYTYRYFDPQLMIERLGLEVVLIDLTQWEAEHLILCPPCKIPRPDDAGGDNG